jgi:hypothetical protein
MRPISTPEVSLATPKYKPMNRSAETSRKVLGFVECGIAAGALVICVLFARYVLGSVYRPWDDEGYMLMSLRNYLSGHHFRVQGYGMFPFLVQELAFKLLRLPVTHDAGRLVTLLIWIASSILGAVFVFRVSRSVLLGTAAGTCCAFLGSALANEPGHPQQAVVALFALAAVLVAQIDARPNMVLAALGAIGVALFCSKANIGAFYFIALFHTCGVALSPGRIRTVALALTSVAGTLMPFVLIRANPEGFGPYFVSVTLCIGITLVSSLRWRPDAAITGRNIVSLVSGAAFAAVAISALTLAHGIPLRALLYGMLIQPAMQPHVFALPYIVSPLTLCFTALILACGLTLTWRGAAIDGLVCITGIAIVVAVLLTDTSAPGAPPRLNWAVALLPLTLAPDGRKRSWPEMFPRVFLACLAALQYLGVYPVAGSQVSIAALPVLLCGFLCVADGAESLASAFRRLELGDRLVLLRAAGGGLLVVTLSGMWNSGLRPQIYPYPPSRLSGATSLHLAQEPEERFEFLTTATRRNCDMLFTLPGMPSFNLWSGVRAPDVLVFGHWAKSSNLGEQARIEATLQADPSACVIYSPANVEFWRLGKGTVEASPLATYILTDMRKVAERGGYEVRVNPNRKAPWIQ